MSGGRCAVLLFALGACAAPEQLADDAHADVRRDVERRLGALPPDEAPVVADARVRALLEGGVDQDEAVRATLLAHRGLVARYAELGVAASDLAQAGLWSNPILDAGFLFFEDGTEIDLGLSQSFVDVLLRPLHEAQARHELDAARARVAREVVAHAYATRRAHVAALAARERLALETKHAAAAEASVMLARRLAEAGNTTGDALAREESALSARLLDRSAAELAARAAHESLCRAMGLWGELARFETAGTLGADPAAGVDLARVESRAIAASLDLAERRAHANSLAQSAGLAGWHAILPDASVGVGAGKESEDSDWGFGPRAAIGVPLADTGATRQYGVEAKLAAAEADAWQRAVEVRSAARTFRDRLRALDADARFARDVHVPAEKRVVLETLRNFNAMQIGPFDVLRAQGVELAAERRAVALLAEAWRARLDLEELLAGSANDARLAAEPRLGSETTTSASSGGH